MSESRIVLWTLISVAHIICGVIAFGLVRAGILWHYEQGHHDQRGFEADPGMDRLLCWVFGVCGIISLPLIAILNLREAKNNKLPFRLRYKWTYPL